MKYRYAEGGLETSLISHDGIDLPLFTAFLALETKHVVKALDRCMRTFAEHAIRDGCGFVMDTANSRASSRWATELDVSLGRLKDLDQLFQLRNELATPESRFVLNGSIGPPNDGFAPTGIFSADAAETPNSGSAVCRNERRFESGGHHDPGDIGPGRETRRRCI